MDEPTIKELRKKTGMSQQQFAEHFNINYHALRSWEGGRYRPREKTISRIVQMIENDDISAPEGAVTVKQLADRLGCTNKNIYLHIKKNAKELEGHIYKKNRFWRLDEYAQNFIEQKGRYLK